MNFAIVGSAHRHITEFIDDMLSMGCRFIGLYDDGELITHSIANDYEAKLYDSIEELLKEDIEVVGTSAVNNRKIDIIELCSSRGIHVMVDNPIITDEIQYTRLKRVIDEGRIQVGLMLTLRFIDEIYCVKELIASGRLGGMVSIEIFNPHKLQATSRSDWFFEEGSSGGIIIDLMIHCIDLFNWLTDSNIDQFSGVLQKCTLKEKPSFYDSCQFQVISRSGVNGYLSTDWHMPDTHFSRSDLRVFITGTRGRIEIRATGDPITRERCVIFYEKGHPTSKLPVEERGLSVTRDFINRVRGKDYILGHRDILTVTKSTIDFNREVKVLNRFI